MTRCAPILLLCLLGLGCSSSSSQKGGNGGVGGAGGAGGSGGSDGGSGGGSACVKRTSGAWTAMSTNGEPSPRMSPLGAWTGTELVVWGGSDGTAKLGDGAAYDFCKDSWKSIDTTGAPVTADDVEPLVAWTGKYVLVWPRASSDGTKFMSGALYDPAANQWITMSTDGQPGYRAGALQLWSGKELFVWGGEDSQDDRNDGARFDPDQNHWSAMSNSGAPSPRSLMSGVWTGSELFVWGGAHDTKSPVDADGREYLTLDDGALYDPTKDEWRPIASGGPAARATQSTGVIDGRVAVFGGVGVYPRCMGNTCPGALADGAFFDPVANAWTTMNTGGLPGDLGMSLLFGEGYADWVYFTGGRMSLITPGADGPNGWLFDPITNKMTAMATTGAPTWGPVFRGQAEGGKIFFPHAQDGSKELGFALFDVAANQWTNVPSLARTTATLVFTGEDALVFGGYLPDPDHPITTGCGPGSPPGCDPYSIPGKAPVADGAVWHP